MAPKTETKTVNGLKCKATSFKRTLPFYKDVGARLHIRESRRNIRKADVKVYLQNRYYLKDEFTMGDSAQLVEFIPPPLGSRVTFKTWRHKHFATGVGIKLRLNGVSPTTGILGLMPLVGVISEVIVSVTKDGNTEQEIFLTQAGSVPDHETNRVFTPRVGKASSISLRNTLVQNVGLSLPISIRQNFENRGIYNNQVKKSLRGGLFMLIN